MFFYYIMFESARQFNDPSCLKFSAHCSLKEIEVSFHGLWPSDLMSDNFFLCFNFHLLGEKFSHISLLFVSEQIKLILALGQLYYFLFRKALLSNFPMASPFYQFMFYLKTCKFRSILTTLCLQYHSHQVIVYYTVTWQRQMKKAKLYHILYSINRLFPRVYWISFYNILDNG